MVAFRLLLGLIVLMVGNFSRAEIMEDFDSLGGNKVLLEKAKALNPEVDVEIVQNRIVDRHQRNEFYPEYGNIIGGDIYMNTQFLGMNYQHHFNPRWSIGAKYSYYLNELRSEGQHLIDQFGFIPELDWPKQSYLGLLNYYPLYGKFSWLGKGVAHFDVYFLLGYGNLELKSGPTEALTAGMGVGIWISRHLTSRLEMRVLDFESERFAGAKKMNLTVLNFGFGYLL